MNEWSERVFGILEADLFSGNLWAASSSAGVRPGLLTWAPLAQGTPECPVLRLHVAAVQAPGLGAPLGPLACVPPEATAFLRGWVWSGCGETRDVHSGRETVVGTWCQGLGSHSCRSRATRTLGFCFSSERMPGASWAAASSLQRGEGHLLVLTQHLCTEGSRPYSSEGGAWRWQRGSLFEALPATVTSPSLPAWALGRPLFSLAQ